MDRFGAANMLAKVYPEFQITTPKPGFELTLVANVDTISPQDAGIVAIFKSHIDSDAKREKACTLLQGFRNYLHYHIKASKTYLHIRMRKRVDLLLQAKDPAKTSKKTITGKTFDRKV
ncbi:hypothetical protein DYB35_011224 [Aphanomyces astaci]|uniref:Arp2/3 complex 34 kDa subunit n=1 Tax=Aphanomyces astaci TaxID=112090 RepID=A0A3R6WMJ5_APHAT|nr:hypothetical protein DYB35_011224 [Aphanomyces astaci]